MYSAVKNTTQLFLLFSLLILITSPLKAADFSEGTANFDFKFSNKILYTNADFMLPLYESPQSSAFFVNPRAGFDWQVKGKNRNNERFSIGLGNRLFLPGDQFGAGLFEKGIIFGFNGHLDWQYSPYDNFLTKGGLGLEVMSDWVDARVNGYLGFTGEKDLGKRVSRTYFYGTKIYRGGNGKDHETLLSGFDGEVGLRLPVIDNIGEMRIYGGAYYLDAGHVSRVSGLTARYEWKPIPFISLGVGWTDNRRLHGEHWQAGIGFHLPFSFNALSSGQSPFALDFTPKTGNLWHDRYTESVHRNGL